MANITVLSASSPVNQVRSDALSSTSYVLAPADQDRLRIAAINAVEEYTGQRFVPEPLTRTLDGSGTGVLYLDRRLADLDTLAVEGSALTASDVMLSEDRTRLHVRAELGALNYYEKVMTQFADNPALFTYGAGSVEIVGTWGWLSTEFPDVVGDAIRICKRNRPHSR